MLRERQGLEPQLLELDATQLHAALGGPTLLHLPGRREPPLFVSVLLHGNETVGWEAVRYLLADYQERGQELPRALSLFIGNTAGAERGLRYLDGQADYNRAWPGSDLPDCPERQLMDEVVARMEARGVFASLDIHNNTGRNPHYGCINRLAAEDLFLARLFSRIMVYFVRPLGVQSMAMGRLCPAATLECGKVGAKGGVEHAREFIDACLHLSDFPEQPLAHQDLEVFHTVARVRVPEDIRFSFYEDGAELTLDPDLDRNNFRELPPGTRFAGVRPGIERPLEVALENGEEAFERFFALAGSDILTRRPLMPSMLTPDTRIIRQDCLCYLMEQMALEPANIRRRTPASPASPAAPHPEANGR